MNTSTKATAEASKTRWQNQMVLKDGQKKSAFPIKEVNRVFGESWRG